MSISAGKLILSDSILEQVSLKFNAVRDQLLNLLGPEVDIHHIGATSVPGLLTKGGLDILIRVEPGSFESAAKALDKSYLRNTRSIRTRDFTAYIIDGDDLDIGIQLAAKGGAFDFFSSFQEKLSRSQTLRTQYNDLKRAAWPSGPDEYRNAKTRFIRSVLES